MKKARINEKNKKKNAMQSFGDRRNAVLEPPKAVNSTMKQV